MVDPGEGPRPPTLIFRPNWGPKGRQKIFLNTRSPSYLRGRMTTPAPLVWRSGYATDKAPRSIATCSLTWDQASFFFSASLLLWLEREKNSAWYIHLTSHQPPRNLHNLTSTWPVMLLANQRLRHGNQILAGIMSLSKSILGKTKFLSMFRWRFLKKIFKCFFFVMKYC